MVRSLSGRGTFPQPRLSTASIPTALGNVYPTSTVGRCFRRRAGLHRCTPSPISSNPDTTAALSTSLPFISMPRNARWRLRSRVVRPRVKKVRVHAVALPINDPHRHSADASFVFRFWYAHPGRQLSGVAVGPRSIQ